jgi:two-component system, chemotaxis family, response regulator Rcp1
MRQQTLYEKPIEVFAAEDNPGDISLLKHAFGQWKTTHLLHIALDGAHMLEILELNAQRREDHRPADLIILDFNMPKLNGIEVLSRIKERPRWKTMPVILFSGSAHPEDIESAYEHFASAFIVKPIDFNDFVDVIRELETFWIRVAQLPCLRKLRKP